MSNLMNRLFGRDGYYEQTGRVNIFCGNFMREKQKKYLNLYGKYLLGFRISVVKFSHAECVSLATLVLPQRLVEFCF